MTIEHTHNKHYPDIPYEVYLEIVYADPTTKRDKSQKGGYCRWLLGLYKKGNLLVEDLYKATEYLAVYTQYKHKILQNVTKLSSLVELLMLVEPFMEKEDSIFTNDEERKLAGEFEQVYKDDKWKIIIPLTLNASKYFGQNTEWCTTNTNQFESYTKNQTSKVTPHNLYILIPMDGNMKRKKQFHFESRQFMNIHDQDIRTKVFFDRSPNIRNMFNEKFPVLKYTTMYKFDREQLKNLTESDMKEMDDFIHSLIKPLKKAENNDLPYDTYHHEENNSIYMIGIKDNRNLEVFYNSEYFFESFTRKFALSEQNTYTILIKKATKVLKCTRFLQTTHDLNKFEHQMNIYMLYHRFSCEEIQVVN